MSFKMVLKAFCFNNNDNNNNSLFKEGYTVSCKANLP